MILVDGQVVDGVLALMIVFIGVGAAYNLALYGLAHRGTSRDAGELRRRRGDAHPTVVYVLPCLNEARVIGASIDRLVENWRPGVEVLVVDDGSDDATAAIVRGRSHPNLHLLQRRAPQARQGKGEALNAAVRHIRSGGLGIDIDPFTTIVCIIDADGQLDAHALEDVLPFFQDPTVGAVQIGVRINNRHRSWLARMQDVEFVLYTSIYQRARRHLGSVGLGGNGQFVRLSALDTLGESPWSHSLTEDLDLGLRMHFRGWDIEFCSTAAVHQQGLVEIGRWVRQRTRWFQGHLQSWPLVPELLRTTRGLSRADLLYHVTSPFLQMLSSLLTAGFAMTLLALGIDAFRGELILSPLWVSAYALTFGPSFLFARSYRSAERGRGVGSLATVLLLHGYVFYSMLWHLAGWSAIARTLFRRNGWAKTERIAEATPAEVTPAEIRLGGQHTTLRSPLPALAPLPLHPYPTRRSLRNMR